MFLNINSKLEPCVHTSDVPLMYACGIQSSHHNRFAVPFQASSQQYVSFDQMYETDENQKDELWQVTEDGHVSSRILNTSPSHETRVRSLVHKHLHL